MLNLTIMKTSLVNYIENFTSKSMNIFRQNISAQNIDCGTR